MYLYVCIFELQDAVPIAALLALCTFMEFLNFDGECCPLQVFFLFCFALFFNKMMYYAINLFCVKLFVAKTVFFSIVHITCRYSGLSKFPSLELYLIWLVLLPELLEICQNGV